MVGENGVPETPDWLPESREAKPFTAGKLKLRLNEEEFLALLDPWAAWDGDQA